MRLTRKRTESATKYQSPADLLVLHAVRVKGMADEDAVARRFSLNRAEVHEHLLDFQASGLVHHAAFGDLGGWSLTEAGRTHNERLLAEELEVASAREVVAESHAAFVPLNARLLGAMTRWQIRPEPGNSTAANDHSDWPWDECVLNGLTSLSRRLRPIEESLSQRLPRFSGYADRFAAALARVDRGERKWVDEPRIDSCHTVWFELHEDLLASLSLARGHDS